VKLQISPTFTLPLDTVTQTFAILGIRGSGKTTTAVVLAEELLRAKQQVVILDPVDVWWGLKSSKSGKEAGFAVPVIGGDHADIPLDGSAGNVLADFVVESCASVIISLRHLSMNDQRRFAGDFAKRLYERKGRQRSPLMLMVDEADEFCSQRIPHGHEAMFGAFDRLVRRGRSSGIGVTLISQRPQVVNKDVLSQMETLVAMRVLHKLDRKALEAWIEAHDTEGRQAEFLGSLASLGRGEAWIWSPSWLNVFERVHIRDRETFDSSNTPKAGTVAAGPKQVADVDLEKLRAQMSAQIEKAKSDDPRALRAEIAKLQAELKRAAGSKTDAGEIERAVAAAQAQWRAELDRRQAPDLQAIAELTVQLRESAARLQQAFERDLGSITSKVQRIVEGFSTRGAAVSKLSPGATATPRTQPVRESATAATPRRDCGTALPVGERATLTVCAQYPDGATREQISILTGYKRSSRDAYIQRLMQRGFVAVGPVITSTDAGLAALGPDFEPLPTGQALRQYWRERLPEGERAILDVLVEAYPRPVDRETLDEETGYKRSSRDAYIQRLKARQLVVISGRGVAASAVLFD